MLRRLARTVDRSVATIDGRCVHVQMVATSYSKMQQVQLTHVWTFPDDEAPVEVYATESSYVMLDAKQQLRIADSTQINEQNIENTHDNTIEYKRTVKITYNGDDLLDVGHEERMHMADDIRNLPVLTWELQSCEGRIKLIACGINHMLVVSEDNKIFARGCNANGQLGIGKKPTNQNVLADIANRNARVERKIFFSEFELCDFGPGADDKIVEVGAGNAHSAVLTQRGEVWVCGEARACGFQPAAHPTMQQSVFSFVHLNVTCYVEGHRLCSCVQCTRYNNTLTANAMQNNGTQLEVREQYGLLSCDSLAVGFNFTAVKVAGTNQIFSTNAWGPQLKTIAMRKKLRLRLMLWPTTHALTCSHDASYVRTATQQHCVSVLANAHSHMLYASVVTVNSTVRMYNLLQNIKIINLQPESSTHMQVRVNEFHSSWVDMAGMYVADFHNRVYYFHEELTQTIDMRLGDPPDLEECLMISPDHLLAWAMTQHKRLGVGVARILTPDVHKLIYKAWLALCVPRMLGPRAVQCVRGLLQKQKIDYDSLIHGKDA